MHSDFRVCCALDLCVEVANSYTFVRETMTTLLVSFSTTAVLTIA